MGWNTDMGAAPQDGTWVEGRNAAGAVARIQSRQTHPMLPLRHWAAGEEVREGNWTRSTCFYPVEWREQASPEPQGDK